LARVRLAKGEEGEARRTLEEALSLFEVTGNVSAANQARSLLPAQVTNP
jgi:hypothetical protein